MKNTACCAKGVSLGIRDDGRAPFDYREVSVDLGIFPHVNGSSRISLGKSGLISTDVVASVKAEVRHVLFGRYDCILHSSKLIAARWFPATGRKAFRSGTGLRRNRRVRGICCELLHRKQCPSE